LAIGQPAGTLFRQGAGYSAMTAGRFISRAIASKAGASAAATRQTAHGMSPNHRHRMRGQPQERSDQFVRGACATATFPVTTQACATAPAISAA